MRIAVCEDNNIVAAFMEDYIASMEAENIEYEILECDFQHSLYGY